MVILLQSVYYLVKSVLERFIMHLIVHMLLYFQVRAEDADMLVMLVHHSSDSHHPLFLTTSNGSYDVRKIKESLSETQKSYLLFCHAFTGCDTVSAIAGHGKTTLFAR